ncbi:MAG: M14 family zinc carboxypeptidase [Candidatus Thermoplasmatota archaeon]|nr:M14 family zinc carboxypeptidase [Candidatus Thermoplasmatota archaeon]
MKLNAAFSAALVLAFIAVCLPASSANMVPFETDGDELYVYTNYFTLKSKLDEMAQAHPDIAKVFSIGQSMEGNDMWCIEIGKFSDANYSEHPGFYLDATHHGDENRGTETAMFFIEFLLENYGKNATANFIVENRRTYVTPMINPDGNIKFVRYNDNIVDLNRNYPHEWGISAENQGASAGSEIEVQNNMAFISSHNLDCYFSLHTGTYDLVRPLCDVGGEYRGFRPEPDVVLYDTVCDKINGLIGMGYRGSSGTGESIAWAYGVKSVFSLLMEVCIDQDLPVAYEDARAKLADPLKACIFMAENADRMCAKLSVETVSNSGAEAVFKIKNEGFGPAINCTFGFAGNSIHVLEIGSGNISEIKFPAEAAESDSALSMEYVKIKGMKTQGGNEVGEVIVQSAYALSSDELKSAGGVSTPGFELLALAAGLCMVLICRKRRR